MLLEPRSEEGLQAKPNPSAPKATQQGSTKGQRQHTKPPTQLRRQQQLQLGEQRQGCSQDAAAAAAEVSLPGQRKRPGASAAGPPPTSKAARLEKQPARQPAGHAAAPGRHQAQPQPQQAQQRSLSGATETLAWANVGGMWWPGRLLEVGRPCRTPLLAASYRASTLLAVAAALCLGFPRVIDEGQCGSLQSQLSCMDVASFL